MNNNLKIDIEDLYGEWHIIYSNFPMWTSGKRKSPSLNYKPRKGNNKYNIHDVVKFKIGNKNNAIEGYDTVLSSSSKFEWKGKGLLSLLKSRWEIVYFGKDWMIIYFEKTLFTPKGYDLVSKVSKPSVLILEKMNAKLKEMEITGLSRISKST